MAQNYRQIFAIKKARREQILKINPNIRDESGIYMFFRMKEETDQFCVYIGQARTSMLDRCASHLEGYKSKNPSHIDLSLKAHGLITKDPLHGWNVTILEQCDKSQCNRLEKKWIQHFRGKDNVIIYNITVGSQGAGKVDFQERKLTQLKRYSNGKNYGYEKARKEIKHLFDKYLEFSIKGKPTKLKEKAVEKFNNFLNCKGAEADGDN